MAPDKKSLPRWLVPACLGCGLGSLLLLVVFLGVVMWGVQALMRNSWAYQEGLARARSSSEVRQALGEPIEPGWFVSGSVNGTIGSGSAELSIPVSGPSGQGSLEVVARESGGKWSFSSLTLEQAEHPSLDLLP